MEGGQSAKLAEIARRAGRPKPTVHRILRTFVESFDFTGHTVHPFVTRAVSGMGEEAGEARPEVEDWLRRAGLA